MHAPLPIHFESTFLTVAILWLTVNRYAYLFPVRPGRRSFAVFFGVSFLSAYREMTAFDRWGLPLVIWCVALAMTLLFFYAVVLAAHSWREGREEAGQE